jgi:hypothetical protein
MPLLLLLRPVLVVARELAEPVVTEENEDERLGAWVKRLGCCSTWAAEMMLGGRLDTVGGGRVATGEGGGGGTVEAMVGAVATAWWGMLALATSEVEDQGFLVGVVVSCVACIWRRGRGGWS